MPLLDVSEVLDDPLFRDDSLVVTSYAQAVNSKGRSERTPTQAPFSGVVTSEGGRTLIRGTDSRYPGGSILVHTRTRLTSGKPNQDADVITWKGQNYTVADIDDYSDYGAGFICATCTPITGIAGNG